MEKLIEIMVNEGIDEDTICNIVEAFINELEEQTVSNNFDKRMDQFDKRKEEIEKKQNQSKTKAEWDAYQKELENISKEEDKKIKFYEKWLKGHNKRTQGAFESLSENCFNDIMNLVEELISEAIIPYIEKKKEPIQHQINNMSDVNNPSFNPKNKQVINQFVTKVLQNPNSYREEFNKLKKQDPMLVDFFDKELSARGMRLQGLKNKLGHLKDLQTKAERNQNQVDYQEEERLKNKQILPNENKGNVRELVVGNNNGDFSQGYLNRQARKQGLDTKNAVGSKLQQLRKEKENN